MDPEKPYPNSGRWLRLQSDEDLQHLVDHSFPGSAAYDGPAGELERRRSERSERRQLFWIRLTFWTALAIGVAGIAVTLLKR